MLLEDEALASLEAQDETQEDSRSAYWEEEVRKFSVTADGTVHGTTVLGIFSTTPPLSHTIAHWFLQWHFRFMGRGYETFGECERLGRLVARRQGRQFTHDMIRQVLSLALIRHYVNLDDPTECNLVFGDGFGVLT